MKTHSISYEYGLSLGLQTLPRGCTLLDVSDDKTDRLINWTVENVVLFRMSTSKLRYRCQCKSMSTCMEGAGVQDEGGRGAKLRFIEFW